jgi:large subunit ribosomal protein L35
MPKQKTVKAVKKRFRKSARGKIKHARAGSGHLMAGKSRKRKRGLRKQAVLSKVESKRIASLLPG